MYYDAGYATSRLRDTLVLYKRQALLVREVAAMDDGLCLISSNYITGAHMVIKLSEATIVNYPLGYVNLEDGVARYIYRMPLRKDWRQGLRSNNVYDRDGPCAMDVIARCLTQTFPTFTMCKHKVKRDRNLVMAWDSNYALSKGGMLLHRGLDIGHVTKKGFELDKPFEYLREDLEDATQ